MKTFLVAALLVCAGCSNQPAKVADTPAQAAAKKALADIRERELDEARNKLTLEELEAVMARLKNNLEKAATGEHSAAQIAKDQADVEQLVFDLAAKH